MKYYSANKLTDNLIEKLKLLGNVLSTLGNNSIRGNHIKYFEDKITELKEYNVNDICLAPHYYAWLCLCSEHIFWLIREFCFKQHAFEEHHLVLDYNKLIRIFICKCKELSCYNYEEIEALYSDIETFLVIRHLHVHGGFPNLLPEILTRLDKYLRPLSIDGKVSKEYKSDEIMEIILLASNPINFSTIKRKFYAVGDFLSKAPSISIGF